MDRIGLLSGLTFADLTIGSFGGHATIQVTATGEFLATVLDEAGNIDASDFVQPLLVGDAGMSGTSLADTNRPGKSPQDSPAAGDQAGLLLVDDGVLSQSELDFIVEAATTRWISTGLSYKQTQALLETPFDVAEMSDWYLGAFDGTGVTIDSDAAGYDWYLDATPFDDRDDLIGDRVDLLTTVMHEMGHVLGIGDIYDSTKSDNLMYGFLSPGERRAPNTGQAAGATPGSVSSESFMISPISIGTLPVGKSVQITFSATVNNGLSPVVTQVSNQGTVSGQNFVNVLTDDPAVGGAANSTITAIDNAPPTVTVNIVDASLSDNDAVSAVTFEFSENVVGFTAADVSVSGGALSDFSAVDGDSFTATFTANGGIDATGSVSVGTGYTDAVGNTGTAGSDNVAIDTLNPTVAVNIVDASLSDNDAVSAVTFEFSEDVVGFTAADVSTSGGTLSGFMAVDGNSFTATFTANGGVDATGSVSVGASSYTDAAGNNGGGGSDNVAIDTLNPTVTVNIVDASVSDNDAVSAVTFEFSENVVSFTATDVSVSGGTLSNFSAVDGNSYTATFTANDEIDATGSMSVGASSYTDAAGNNGGGGSDNVVIDTLNPTVTVNIIDTSLSDNDAESSVTFEFSENIVGFTAADVSVSDGTLSNFSTVDGNSFTATFTANGGINATGSVSVGAASYTDAAGNNGSGGSDNVVIDTLNPTVTVNIVDASLSDNDAVSEVTFEFSENVVGFTAADVSTSGGTLSDFSEVDGNSFTATFTANGGIDATGSVSVGATSYADSAGNGGGNGSDTVTIDTENPDVTVTPDGIVTTSSPVTFTVQFSEAVTGFTVGDLSVVNGVAGAFTAIDADTFVVEVTPAAPGTVTVEIAGGAAQDLAGNSSTSDAASVIRPGIGEVTLPSGGAYVLLVSGADLVLRIAGGSELFRRPVLSVTEMRIMGSSGADAVTVLSSGGNVATPVLFVGNDGADEFDASLATGPTTIHGGAGNDTLRGGTGVDVVQVVGASVVATNGSSSGEGADTLSSIEGLILIAGSRGSSIDASAFTQGPVTIVGSSGADTLTGGSGDDFIVAGSGRDSVSGNAGGDFIVGGSGRDTFFGNTGDDTIVGGGGRDSLDGGQDDDRLRGGSGFDTISGGSGNDLVLGGGGRDLLDGDDGADTLVGGGGADNIAGGAGSDTLNGSFRDDVFNEVVGRDTLIGGLRPEGRPAPVDRSGKPSVQAEMPEFESPQLLNDVNETGGLTDTQESDEVFTLLLLPELLDV